jgi:ubiquinone/menaquinone biosynthesis C-methylase UbiE
LAPFAATGQAAVELAKLGFEVVAMDCCDEMLEIARQKAAHIGEFSCREGHVVDLAREDREFDFVFLAGGNYHHFWEEIGQLTVLDSVHRLLRPGGGFALEMMPFTAERPSHEVADFGATDSSNGAALKVHSESSYSAESRMVAIRQMMTVTTAGRSEEDRYQIPLRMFTRVELMASLAETGFRRVAEYGSYDFHPHTPHSSKWIVEARKRLGS